MYKNLITTITAASIAVSSIAPAYASSPQQTRSSMHDAISKEASKFGASKSTTCAAYNFAASELFLHNVGPNTDKYATAKSKKFSNKLVKTANSYKGSRVDAKSVQESINENFYKTLGLAENEADTFLAIRTQELGIFSVAGICNELYATDSGMVRDKTLTTEKIVKNYYKHDQVPALKIIGMGSAVVELMAIGVLAWASISGVTAVTTFSGAAILTGSAGYIAGSAIAAGALAAAPIVAVIAAIAGAGLLVWSFVDTPDTDIMTEAELERHGQSLVEIRDTIAKAYGKPKCVDYHGWFKKKQCVSWKMAIDVEELDNLANSNN
jgi:hypothetical protein